MLMPLIALVVGIAFLVYSADKFIDGASATARYSGMNPLLIGMLIVGFGTSAPEILVSIVSALEGNPGLALGNAIGSNTSNIALILGISALIIPLTVASNIVRSELPLLIGVSLFMGALLFDGFVSFYDGVALLGVFLIFLVWSIIKGRKGQDKLGDEVEELLDSKTPMTLAKALVFLIGGLVVLVVSSRVMVWGAVELAKIAGVSDLVVGLTIVALGTSLPELASSIIAARKGEHDIAIGNVVGSNMFNTLVVVGIAGVISPLEVPPEFFTRDYSVMLGLTILMFAFGFRIKKAGRINRLEGGFFVLSYVAYTVYLISTATAS